MLKRIPVVYIYHSDTTELETYTRLTSVAATYGYGSYNEEIHHFAVNELERVRIEISNKFEDILYNEHDNTYTVWLKIPDEKLAVFLISKYLCNQYEKIFKDYNAILKTYSNALSGIEKLINKTK